MNTRDYKQFAPGEYYHVFNRGNAKANIFLDSEDYNLFLSRLIEAIYPDRSVNGAHSHKRNQRKPLPKDSFSLVAYCLMPNHFHLLLGQKAELPISLLMGKVCTSYSKIFNKKYDRVGSLFQDQFKAVLVESDAQLRHLTGYIHLNPQKAGIGEARTYPYSSYSEYLGASGFCEKDIVLGAYKDPRTYRSFVENDATQHDSYVQALL